MKFLILGKSGQLSSELQRSLRGSEHSIDVQDSRKIDFDDLEILFNKLEKLDFDVLVNTVAWTDVDAAEKNAEEAFRINANLPKNLALAVRSKRKTFVQISTDYVFSGESIIPWGINSITQPINTYGKTKALAEEYIQEIYSENSYIFRTSWLYSPFRKNFVKTMIAAALKNDQILNVVDDQWGQPTSAKDLAGQIIRSLEHKISPGIYHATNSGLTTWNIFAKKIFELIGENPDRIKALGSTSLIRDAVRPKYSVLSHECWSKTCIQPMRPWQNALEDQISEIKSFVISEGK